MNLRLSRCQVRNEQPGGGRRQPQGIAWIGRAEGRARWQGNPSKLEGPPNRTCLRRLGGINSGVVLEDLLDEKEIPTPLIRVVPVDASLVLLSSGSAHTTYVSRRLACFAKPVGQKELSDLANGIRAPSAHRVVNRDSQSVRDEPHLVACLMKQGLT